MKKIPFQWLIIGLGLVLYLLHFLERDPSNPYSRPIVSDAKGYYAYLPAVFIYQDLDYGFIAEMDQKYYAVGHDKHIFIEVNGERVNKTFPGIALLYLPFFLIAHFLALLLGLEADGYSLIYQYLFDFGQFFYATLGLLFASKFLAQIFPNKFQVFLSVLVIVLGTNFWFYTIYDQSVTHIYNFCLISCMLYLLIRFQEEPKAVFLIQAVVISSILLIVRPTGVLSFVLIPFFFQERTFYQKLWQTLKVPKVFIAILIGALAVISIPLLLWKFQSGKWIVYSYGEEGFNFLAPHVQDFLFSYAKGWWLYSPIILMSIILGIIVLIKKKDTNRIFPLIAFLSLSVYVFSSWWCWYYGFSFGQRVMVDFYLLFIYLLALSFQNLPKRLWLVLGPLFGFFIFLNLHQSYQHYHGYYQTPTPTSEMYWDNFLNFQKTARVYLDKDEIVMNAFEFDFEGEGPEYSGFIVEHSGARSGRMMTMVDQKNEFSGNLNIGNKWFSSRKIIVEAYINAQTVIEKTCLVIEHSGISDTYRSYPLREYVVRNKWIKVSFFYDNSFSKSSEDIHIYFWNQGAEEQLFIDDVKVLIID